MPDSKNNDTVKFESALKKLIKKLQKAEPDRTEPDRTEPAKKDTETVIEKTKI